jgi:hypothetical protein
MKSQPYAIPVKFSRQCDIGALRHLSPEEYEEREWAVFQRKTSFVRSYSLIGN